MESLQNRNRQHMYAWVVMPHLWVMDLVNNMVFFSIGVLIHLESRSRHFTDPSRFARISRIPRIWPHGPPR